QTGYGPPPQLDRLNLQRTEIEASSAPLKPKEKSGLTIKLSHRETGSNKNAGADAVGSSDGLGGTMIDGAILSNAIALGSLFCLLVVFSCGRLNFLRELFFEVPYLYLCLVKIKAKTLVLRLKLFLSYRRRRQLLLQRDVLLSGKSKAFLENDSRAMLIDEPFDVTKDRNFHSCIPPNH
ncbi:MAG TPA: hypothetical protein VI382_10115, partial [Candidatus Manganitrophaceae bacterium]|nr:hypothetical protein [Candidatus Manganitrophaceae bacterium]